MNDIEQAARFVLPHRQRRRPAENPRVPTPNREMCSSNHHESQSDVMEGQSRDEQAAPRSQSRRFDNSSESNSESDADGRAPDNGLPGERIFPAEIPASIPSLRLDSSSLRSPQVPGRSYPGAGANSGRYVRAHRDAEARDVALTATIRAAAVHGPNANGGITVERSDLHRKEREARTGTLILFVVDASGSMGVRRQMEAVKGAVLSLLADAYQQRDRVGVIAFRGPAATLLLPPGGSAELARETLELLPTGGRTPLAHALRFALEII